MRCVLAANQRWPARKSLRRPRPCPSRRSTTTSGSESDLFDAIEDLLLPRGLEAEPVVAVGRQADEVRLFANGGEPGLAQELDRRVPGPGAEVELDGLGRAGEIVDGQNRLALVLADVGEYAVVGGAQETERPPAEHPRLLAGPDEVLHPVEQRGRRALLCLDIDRLVAVDG